MAHADRIQDLFERARALPPEAREPYLAARCDEATAREVLELLEYDIADDFLTDPVEFQPSVGAVGGTASAEPMLTPDTQLEPSRFRILRTIGSGGMGVVYEAEQLDLRRRVAIKVLREHAMTPGAMSCLRREGRAMSGVSHPGIVTVLAIGETDGFGEPRPFIAMELIKPGTRITAYAARAGLADRDIAALSAEVCEAVGAAHEAGLVHRDLKPANILMDHRGMPRVIDFGIAMLHDEVAEDEGDDSKRRFLGTLAYMSPEQIDGAPADARTDVYALGVVLYQMLTKTADDLATDTASLTGRATAGQSLRDVIDPLVGQRPPRPRSVRRSIPTDLDEIVWKAIAADPAQRYDNASELADDLRKFLSGKPVQAGAATPLRAGKRVLRRPAVRRMVAAVSLVLAGAAAAVALLKPQPAESRTAAPYSVALADAGRGLRLFDAIGGVAAELRSTRQGFVGFTSARALDDPSARAGVRVAVIERTDSGESLLSWEPFANQTDATELRVIATSDEMRVVDVDDVFAGAQGQEILVLRREVSSEGETAARLDVRTATGALLGDTTTQSDIAAAAWWLPEDHTPDDTLGLVLALADEPTDPTSLSRTDTSLAIFTTTPPLGLGGATEDPVGPAENEWYAVLRTPGTHPPLRWIDGSVRSTGRGLLEYAGLSVAAVQQTPGAQPESTSAPETAASGHEQPALVPDAYAMIITRDGELVSLRLTRIGESAELPEPAGWALERLPFPNAVETN